MSKRLALITGASAGIGAAFAKVYAQQGFDLALTARRKERLDALAAELEKAHGAKSLVAPADLTDPDAPKALVDAIGAAGRQIDVLVNNAGYGLPGGYAKTKWEDQAVFFQIMATAPARLAHLVLPGMLERRYGRIINVASLAGIVPGGPGHTLYGAVKAFLIRFSESLNAETSGTGVHVTALCPGFTYSEFHDVNGTRASISTMPKWMFQDAIDVAQAGYEAAERNVTVAVPGGVNKGLAALARLLPDPLANAMVRSNANKFRRMD